MPLRPRRSCAWRSKSTCASSPSWRRASSSSVATKNSARSAPSSRHRPDAMYYELALIAVFVAGGYWGWYFARHDQTRLYGLLMLASAALSGLGFVGERFDKQ